MNFIKTLVARSYENHASYEKYYPATGRSDWSNTRSYAISYAYGLSGKVPRVFANCGECDCRYAQFNRL